MPSSSCLVPCSISLPDHVLHCCQVLKLLPAPCDVFAWRMPETCLSFADDWPLRGVKVPHSHRAFAEQAHLWWSRWDINVFNKTSILRLPSLLFSFVSLPSLFILRLFTSLWILCFLSAYIPSRPVFSTVIFLYFRHPVLFPPSHPANRISQCVVDVVVSVWFICSVLYLALSGSHNVPLTISTMRCRGMTPIMQNARVCLWCFLISHNTAAWEGCHLHLRLCSPTALCNLNRQ